MSASNNSDFRPPIGEPSSNFSSDVPTATNQQSDDFVRPRIVRDRSVHTGHDLSPDDLEGDHYFEPPIIRAENLKNDERLSALLAHNQCPILLSDLIQALHSID